LHLKLPERMRHRRARPAAHRRRDLVGRPVRRGQVLVGKRPGP
jgi:hypothetical protein